VKQAHADLPRHTLIGENTRLILIAL